VRVLLLADTHLADTSSRRLDDEVLAAAGRADLILHAGDITGAALLAELGGLAPVVAVLGNNDVELVGELPEQRELDLDGVAVALVHDAGPRAGRAARLRRWFPAADLVVYGHSHQPDDSTGEDGLRIVNPGSPTQRRRAPTRTYGELVVDRGRIVELELRHLDPVPPS